jgi:hypothetical protein
LRRIIHWQFGRQNHTVPGKLVRPGLVRGVALVGLGAVEEVVLGLFEGQELLLAAVILVQLEQTHSVVVVVTDGIAAAVEEAVGIVAVDVVVAVVM